MKQKELFPGRRGHGRDMYFFPLDFSEYIRIFGKTDLKQTLIGDIRNVDKAMKGNSMFSETIYSLFLRYLRTGGFPLPIREFFEKKKVSNKTIKIYLDWLKGDWRKIGKSDRYMKEVVTYILKARASPISWPNNAISVINNEQVGFEVKWGMGHWKKPMHLKKVLLLDKDSLSLFLCSVKWCKS